MHGTHCGHCWNAEAYGGVGGWRWGGRRRVISVILKKKKVQLLMSIDVRRQKSEEGCWHTANNVHLTCTHGFLARVESPVFGLCVGQDSIQSCTAAHNTTDLNQKLKTVTSMELNSARRHINTWLYLSTTLSYTCGVSCQGKVQRSYGSAFFSYCQRCFLLLPNKVHLIWHLTVT